MSGEGLSPEERRLLLRVARDAIGARLCGRELTRPTTTPALERGQGAFVTLTRRADDELRGCVGLLGEDRPLLDAVMRAAVAAATDDGRFPPVTLGELGSLAVEISALGPLRPIRPEKIEVGTHGLMVRHGRHHGLLLPQVAAEHGWDRETFLAKTCWKAGLPEDTWRKPGVEILGFTAEVFGEESVAPGATRP